MAGGWSQRLAKGRQSGRDTFGHSSHLISDHIVKFRMRNYCTNAEIRT